jgi:hypothetical protein
MVKQTKFTLLPYQNDLLDQMVEMGEARNRQNAIEKLIADKIQELQNKKSLEQFHYNNY